MVRSLLFFCISLLAFSCGKITTDPVPALYLTADVEVPPATILVDGRAVKLTTFRMYLSNIKILTTDGDTVNIKDYILYDYPGDGSSIKIADLPVNKMSRIFFSVGLDPVLNNSNPVTFPAGHPLSLDKDMHWGMLKYRFIVAEGAFDSTAAKTGPANFPFSIHLGTDFLYREKSYALPADEISELHIMIDPLEMFSGIFGDLDIRDYYSNHSSPGELAEGELLMDNFVSGISVTQVVL